MKREPLTMALAIVLAITLLLAPGASAQDFKVGDRVQVGSLNEAGTVIDVNPATHQIKVHLDRLGPGFPTVGSWFDPKMSQVTPGGGPAPANNQAQGQPPHQANSVGPEPPPTSNEAASEALFKKLIRRNFQVMFQAFDVTVGVTFKNFQMGAPAPHEDIYAGDHPAPYAHGRTVNAYPIRAACDVLVHHAGPNSPDELRHYDTNYLGFKANDEWIIKTMLQNNPNCSTPTYINK